QPHVQVQEVIAGSSYLSMDSLDLEFGLGAATTAEKIEIRWPSGVVQTLQNVAANQVMEIVEPQG
ncbi:MAG: ASPIC/UnbV domain-containing protein, partial [Chloroflexi bacterium]|nr:ASPIC/UnbV domain-containing protein [Chloroflexota bacterium]